MRSPTATNVLIAGIMEHIEEAGVHSGDSSCVLPPQSLPATIIGTIEEYTVRLAQALNVIGLMNVQYAIKNGTVYVLEVNPRASRTVPYVSKATGVPLPKIAVGLMSGTKLKDLRISRRPESASAGAAVLRQVAGVPVQQVSRRGSGARSGDALDRRSDGRRRELRRSLPESADQRRDARCPDSGTVFISVNDRHKAGGRGGRANGSPSSASSWWRRAAPPPRSRRRAAVQDGLQGE